MIEAIFLDSEPLGLLTQRPDKPQANVCNQWLADCIAAGYAVYVPEIVDYELRRELLRANQENSITRLDALYTTLRYVPLTTEAMRQAAQFWAQARQQGRPTAGDKTIDADMILAAQAVTLNVSNFIIATVNVKHFANFVPADFWQNIS